MKTNQFNTAAQKLKSAGLITYIGLMSLFAPRDASAQQVGEEFTITTQPTEVLGGATNGYKNTRITLANAFDKVFPIYGSISTFVDNPKQQTLCRIDSLSNGYILKSYYQNDKRQEFLQGMLVYPNNRVLESAQNEVLMENIKNINILTTSDGRINGFEIVGGSKRKNDAYVRYYDEKLNLIYDCKTRKGDYERVCAMERENAQAHDQNDQRALSNPQIQARLQEMQKSSQK